MSRDTAVPTIHAPRPGESRPPATPSNAELAAIWTEARLAYPVYAALASEFGLAPLPYAEGELPPARPTRSLFARDLQWLDSIDKDLLAYQLRQAPPQTLHASEPSLRAFIQRQLRKPQKSTADRDKVDWLLVQYFGLCAPAELLREEIRLEDVARVLRPVLDSADLKALGWYESLDTLLRQLEGCTSLRDLMENGLLEQGRMLKESAGAGFYEHGVLVAFCRFNFLLRRTFIRLLHADLSAIREEIEALETKNVKTVDCRRAGFSAAEATSQLGHFCDNWKQPFQKDYTESSVTRCFEQLLALRTDLEEALGRIHPSSGKPSPEAARPLRPAAEETRKQASVNEEQSPSVSSPEASSRAQVSHEPTPPAAPGSASESGKYEDAILKQLNAAPLSGGMSMSTILLQDTKVLLSSWEVAAFVNNASQESGDLRRAIVARALLAVAVDRRKRSGEESPLNSALALARREMSYFEGRVEDAKRTRNIEAAVNLGISAKRLLAFVEEAEKLQP